MLQNTENAICSAKKQKKKRKNNEVAVVKHTNKEIDTICPELK